MSPSDIFVLEENAEELGVSRRILMENAGKAVCDYVIKILRERLRKKIEESTVVVMSGVGNNGGDGFVAARYLSGYGVKTKVFLVGKRSEIRTEEARSNWRILENMEFSVDLVEIRDSKELERITNDISKADVVVDAILGTGVRGKLREPIKTAVKIVNEYSSLIISVDVPTGLDAETGEILGDCVKADYTVTFHRMKKGISKNSSVCGEVFVAPIGIPKDAEFIVGKGDVKMAFPKRRAESHKGDYGRILILGGSRDYSGAPAFSALAALKTGVDLVFIVAPESVCPIIKSYSPSLIVRGYPGDYLNEAAKTLIFNMMKKIDAVLIGPGLSKEEETLSFLREKVIPHLRKRKFPTVVDADAISIFKDNAGWENMIITPHGGEFKHLYGSRIKEGMNLKERVEIVRQVSKKLGATIVLKGHYDIISNGVKSKVNRTGNPGMTVGGTGDSLAGIATALLAMGRDSFTSACVAAYINGKAGDIAASKLGFHLTTEDVISDIPKAIEDTLSS
ncbi:MAG: NAD(P)H-hydrate dehydratase [Candidatus Odinarchaeota archaeon]|nr:NAD(P)H-hydrate dehydratase [Candidatus Odinarchaeota archaeon]